MPALFSAALLFQAIFSINNLLPTWYYFQEISINLGIYWLGAHIVSLIVLAGLRRRLNAGQKIGWPILLVILSWQYVEPLLELSKRPEDQRVVQNGLPFRVFLANVLTPNDQFAALRAQIDEAKPDLIALMEVDDTWTDKLKLRAAYPHTHEITRDDSYGLALYSRFPFEGEMITNVGEGLPPVIHTSIAFPNGQRVETFLVHSLQPLFVPNFHANRVLIRRLSTPLRHSENPVLFLGDINATWYSGLYKRIRQAGDLADASAGFGIWRTWHAEQPLVRLTIDHIFYRGIVVQNFQRGEKFGSDHFPLISDFLIPELT